MTLLPTALKYRAAGLSIIPIKTDGTKAPLGEWKCYQNQRAAPPELLKWFGNGVSRGLAVIGGKVSGNLEILDFDIPGWYERFEVTYQQQGLASILEQLPKAVTPSGGAHLFYRCEAVEGNRTLARALLPIPPGVEIVVSRQRRIVVIDGKEYPVVEKDGENWALETAIETRGEGGYAVVYPSPAAVHPSGNVYQMERGELTGIPIITPEEREQLFRVVRSLSEWEPPPPAPRPWVTTGIPEDGFKPGDDYNQRGDIEGLLQRHGWGYEGASGDTSYWRRPGKTRGHSATFNHDGNGLFFCFTSNAAPFEPATGYRPFTVYSLLEHDGNFESAARALGREGFGENFESVTIPIKSRNGRKPEPETTDEPDTEDDPGGPETEDDKAGEDEDDLSEANLPAYPYKLRGRRIIYLKVSGAGDSRKNDPVTVCEFYATITVAATTEDGRHLWTLAGKTIHRKKFELELEARQFADGRQLKAALTGVAGPSCSIAAKMENHLGPAIQKLTKAYGKVQHIRQYDRTGWQDSGFSHFLLPGHTKDSDVRIRLPAILPYRVEDESDLVMGLASLESLLLSKPAEFSTVALAALLWPAAARLTGIGNKRYCLFVTGQTGSFKTSFITALMGIWGPEFPEGDRLCKWGEGGTSNALNHIATYASDLPFLIDNYKPGTGGGQKAFVALMHNCLEGGEKLRLQQRRNQLRETREIHAWPVCTGEDVPGSDGATLARLLVLHSRRDTTGMEHLTRGQAGANQLCAIGREWICWLESRPAVLKTLEHRFHERRNHWREVMEKSCGEGSPHARIASNLAVNELAGRLVSECPFLAPLWTLLNSFDGHQAGLREIAESMASGSIEAGEARRFLTILSELLASGAAQVAPRLVPLDEYVRSSAGNPEPDRLIGWKDPEGYYLLPELARKVVERVSGDALSDITAWTLNKQLKEGGYLAGHDASHGKLTKKIKDRNGGTHNVLWLKLSALQPVEDDE